MPKLSREMLLMTYVALDNLADITPCLFQDRLDAQRTLPCLVCDASLDKFALLVGGDLPGDVDCVAGLDSLCLNDKLGRYSTQRLAPQLLDPDEGRATYVRTGS